MAQLGLHGVKINLGACTTVKEASGGGGSGSRSEVLQCCEEQAEVSKPAEPLAELISNKEAGAVGGLQPLNLDSAL